MKLQNVIPILIGIACFALFPNAQAVVPAPDGGYPGGNTAEGQAALFSLTTGGFNTALGFLSLRSNTTNSFNTAVGAGTLLSNMADQNTAMGAGALLSNTTGTGNTADGAFALFSNTTAVSNTAVGDRALFSNTASSNTAVGFGALVTNSTGGLNTANGSQALSSNTTGGANTAIGQAALENNTIGGANTALGFEAGINVTTASNVICIGTGGSNVSNTCFIANIRNVTTQNANAIPVLIDSAGQLGTASSSRRYKTDIKAIDKASESILALKPVTFRYKVHKDTAPQFGLIAEDVAEVNPNLVIYDADGKPYTVRYEAVNAMLLNEFLKEYRKVKELESTVVKQEAAAAKQDASMARQQKQIEALNAGLQKVSAQLEASKPGRKWSTIPKAKTVIATTL
jgi:Chaperone of endosialidase